MSYFYMSNINDFSNVHSPVQSYQQIGKYDSSSTLEEPSNGVITFKSIEGIDQKANFLMIRAHNENDLLVQLYPSQYGTYIPAGELWAVDSLNEIEKIFIRNIFSTTGTQLNSGKIQWMIGYK